MERIKEKRNISPNESRSRSSEKQKSEQKRKRKGLSYKDIKYLLGLNSDFRLLFKTIKKVDGKKKIFLIPEDAGEIDGRYKQVKRHTLQHKKALKESMNSFIYNNPEEKNSDEELDEGERFRYFIYQLYKQTHNRELRIKQKNNPDSKTSRSGKKNRKHRKESGSELQEIRKIWKRAHKITNKKIEKEIKLTKKEREKEKKDKIKEMCKKAKAGRKKV